MTERLSNLLHEGRRFPPPLDLIADRLAQAPSED